MATPGPRSSRTYARRVAARRGPSKSPTPIALPTRSQIPRRIYELHTALTQLVGPHIWPGQFIEQVQRSLREAADLKVELRLHSSVPKSLPELFEEMPGVRVIAVIGMSPLPFKVLVDIDQTFVKRAINQVLGGPPWNSTTHRPLTEVEQGILSFLLLKVLNQFTDASELFSTITLRLEDMRSHISDCMNVSGNESDWMVYRWFIDDRSGGGHARVLVPLSVTEAWRAQAAPKTVDHFRTLFQRHGHRLQTVMFFGRILVDSLNLLPVDLARLEPGDIILMDATEDPSNTPPSSPAGLHMGAARPGVVLGTVYLHDGRRKFRLGASVLQKPKVRSSKSTHRMQMTKPVPDSAPLTSSEPLPPHDAPSEDDTRSLGQAILPDLPVTVAIELGRVELRAEDILRLHPGQVIDLGRNVSEPVHLVAGDRLLARGELVDIDGKLGLRILHLTEDYP